MKRPSLRFRLLSLFTAALLGVWAAASVLAWKEIDDEIGEILDAQLVAFAEHLRGLDIPSLLDRQKQLNPPSFQSERETLAFAVYDKKGTLLLNKGLYGFIDVKSGDIELSIADGQPRSWGRWRMLWLSGSEKNYRIVAGQSLSYREELASDAIESQLLPWMIMLPIFLFSVYLLLGREFRPMREAAEALSKRSADDATPLNTSLPREIGPFVDALNALFVRVSGLLWRERRFTSDAAHELRSPLAGLRVQAEVAQLTEEGDTETRNKALNKLTLGIDRMAHLVDQMLNLSRLDSLDSLTDIEDIDWRALVKEALDSFRKQADARRITLSLDCLLAPPLMRGQRLLLMLLLRNLLDNAIRYSLPGGGVKVILEETRMSVEDNGQGVLPSNLNRLGERFFRLAGQNEPGTGLGLSIVRRVADLHGFRVVFSNRIEGGLRVEVFFKP